MKSQPEKRNGKERRISDRIFYYADGDASATILYDTMHMIYRIEIREAGKLLTVQESHLRTKALKIARESVQYLNRRGR